MLDASGLVGRTARGYSDRTGKVVYAFINNGALVCGVAYNNIVTEMRADGLILQDEEEEECSSTCRGFAGLEADNE